MKVRKNLTAFGVLGALVIALTSFMCLAVEQPSPSCIARNLSLRLQANPISADYLQFKGDRIKLTDGAIVEGSIDHGGIQPHYIIDANSEPMAQFLKGAEEIGKLNLPFWDKVDRVAHHTRMATNDHWRYEDVVYRSLLKEFREKEQNIPLSEYLVHGCGVCREQGMLLNLALQRAGFDSNYLYVNISRDGINREDHAFATVLHDSEEWVVDSRIGVYTGRKLSDLLKPGGIRANDAVAPINRKMAGVDPVGIQVVIADFPNTWIPKHPTEKPKTDPVQPLKVDE